jgi:hypothetical protein
LRDVNENFGCFTRRYLRDLIQEDLAWSNAIKSRVVYGNEIPLEALKRSYKDRLDYYRQNEKYSDYVDGNRSAV